MFLRVGKEVMSHSAQGSLSSSRQATGCILVVCNPLSNAEREGKQVECDLIYSALS